MRPLCVPSGSLSRARLPLACARLSQRHFLHTARKSYDVAVLGGGITGLTTAYRLAQDPSCSKVTLYEKSSQVGGWMKSERIPVEGGDVVFEYGPRTLRAPPPASLPMLDLINDIGLFDDVKFIKKSSPAGRNRFIYYPDHLVNLSGVNPFAIIKWFLGTVRKLLTEPAFKTLAWCLLRERSRPAPAPYPADESIAQFVSRRMSPEVADNLASAMVQGIYAGDIDRLSAQTILGPYREIERMDNSIIRGILNMRTSGQAMLNFDPLLAMDSVAPEKSKLHWAAFRSMLKESSVFTMRDGLGQIPDALAAALAKSDKVEVLTGTEVKSLGRKNATSNLAIQDSKGKQRLHNRVIATTPAPALAQALKNGLSKKPFEQSIKALEAHNYAVTVRVVNLYYSNPDLLPVRGFGYLIPRSVPGEQNPERALGVIFASETSKGQETAPGTKLTVMMGGHYWDGWSESDYPDHDEAVSMCKSLLHRHLNITEEPVLARSALQRDCIPQYTVGHDARMKELSATVQDEFDKRLSLAGSWYTGVSVHDCVKAGYIAATYGVGAKKVAGVPTERPWKRYNYEHWDLEGGIAALPVRAGPAFHDEMQ